MPKTLSGVRMAPGDRRRPRVLVRSRRGTTPRRCRACRATPRLCRGSGRRVSFPARTALGEHRSTDAYRRSSPRRFPGGRRTAWRNLSRRGRHIPTGPRWAAGTPISPQASRLCAPIPSSRGRTPPPRRGSQSRSGGQVPLRHGHASYRRPRDAAGLDPWPSAPTS